MTAIGTRTARVGSVIDLSELEFAFSAAVRRAGTWTFSLPSVSDNDLNTHRMLYSFPDEWYGEKSRLWSLLIWDHHGPSWTIMDIGG